MLKIASLVPYKIIPPVTGGEKAIFYFLKYVARYANITCFTVTENAGEREGIHFTDVLGSTTKKAGMLTSPFFVVSKTHARWLV
ncbi:hypothetical protein KRR40_22250 [Niabella defluvii]|nr:hypothetical protein KRR40_22250 [Niabella sp. I65]